MRGEAGSAAAPRVYYGMRPIHVQCTLAALLIALLAACATQQPAEVAKIDRVLSLIQQRLAIADDVARNKWGSGAPIEDLPREREIIEGLADQAARYGLAPVIARDFFRAQIEASKIIQHARFREWRAAGQPKFEKVRDLGRQIRPELDALTPALMTALADAMPVLRAPGAAAIVSARAVVIVTGVPADAPARETAVAPLERVSSAR